MPVAAIEALIELISHMTISTTMELQEVIRAQINRLKASVANPVPPAAGAELFLRFILKTLSDEADGAGPTPSASNRMTFEEMRAYLVRNSRGFAAQARVARNAIAEVGSRYVLHGETVLTTGGSRCVTQLLLKAAKRRTRLHGSVDFRVIYVLDSTSSGTGAGGRRSNSDTAVAALRAAGVPVATIDPAATAHAMNLGNVKRVFVGAEAVCQRGGVMSRMGTYQLAKLAQKNGTDFYVVTETHKFAMVTPLQQKDLAHLGVKQNALDFKKGPGTGEDSSYFQEAENQGQVDYTPPELVKGIITEQGVKMPSHVLEFLLHIFHT